MKETQQMLFAQIIAVTGALFAGVMLANVTGVLKSVPGILVMLPAFLEMRGNISGTLAARLGTAFHKGFMKGRRKRKIQRNSIRAAFIMTFIISLLIGVLAWAISLLIGFSANIVNLVIISVSAGLISSAILVTFTVSATNWFFKRGYDPDDVMGPLITTIGDIVSVFSLILVALVVTNV